MLKQLQNIFPSMIIYSDDFNKATGNYQWFITETNEIIGIDKSELTKKDTSILAAFLTPYDIQFPVPTEHEKTWKNRINNGALIEAVTPYRFVYFSIKKNQTDPKLFKEALDEFFTKPAPILWENEHEGIIIEEQTADTEENISYGQIIDVLMSDLYVKIKFLVGPYLDNLKNIDQYYHSFIKGAKTAFAYSDKSVITYIDAISYILLDLTDVQLRSEITAIVLKEFKTNEDVLHTIKTFIECNLNVSLAAKELYMHRNSLQYRLDKFIEKTGVDIRQFNQAMIVYLAILANMHKSD
ncbi:helix-turn-helix domain-containing protein [Virgibacillus sp. NKC19-16]|uniref:PucR family transcriptional regulator n=1 Tax=Virgibacillus salidurans TaxID=2831673 RepID=UPI001F2A8402|nr:helix-turn-helix domain-containing protein [Virgibacillus sp. NKC19-16]UJL47555.1 helix-turn-helix domain-containing protein [Virgibacillus sp. NKC19-16]